MSRKPKSTPEDDLPVQVGHEFELAGLLVIAIAVVAGISLVSNFVEPGGKNILGEYLGTWLATHLNLLNGSLPSILLITALVTLGIRLIQFKPENFSFKQPLVLAALYLLAGVMLSIKNIALTTLGPADFTHTGGFFGNFLVQQLFLPIFGKTVFGPYLICGMLIFFVVIWGFKLRIAQVIEKFVEFMGILVFPVFDALDTLKLKRLRRHKKLQERLLGQETSALLLAGPRAAAPEFPLENDKPESKKRRVKKAVEPGPLDTAVDAEFDELLFEPPVELTDPFEIRKWRDHQKEIKRISELNQWEVEQRAPTIGGLLSKLKEKQEEGPKPKGKKKAVMPALEDEQVLEKILEDGPELSPEGGDENESVVNIVPSGKKSPGKLLVNDTSDEDDLDDVDDEIGVEELDSYDTTEPEPEPEPVPEIKYDEYIIPEIDDVLDDPPDQPIDYTEEELKRQGRVLEEELANFKVMGKVVGICSGPVIIRYEVELAPGVKVNKVSGLSDDLAMAMRASRIRILAPIPGKSAVGIEVPNRSPQIVFIKDILKSPAFKSEPDSIKLVLGKDIAGEPCTMDLTKAPHLLIAGQTGSGKSVCINSIMTSILFSKTPDEVRMILVDPKVVELKPYNQIPHLLAPVVTQPEVAVQALKWATVEMDRRYDVLARAGVRNIKGFNQKFRKGALEGRVKKEDNKVLPFIIIVIDELADLMMVAGKDVETSIARIAQKARAVGLHLILATQRPSTNVITGTIKANLPTRVAFQVASQIDARTIMDRAGSEKLLGKGDMLFRSIDSPEPERIHGSFIDDEQTEKLANVCASQFVNYPHIPSFETELESSVAEEEDIPRDTKFRDAAELVVSVGQASTSMLQRRMAIGYARAGRLMDSLERAGIVGRDRGSKPREVLMTELEVASFLSSGLND